MFDLTQFYTYREDNRLEVKKAKDGLPSSLWETYSAFANSYGGIIVLGVKENKDGSWQSTGLENPAKLQKIFWDTIHNITKVSINLLTDKDVQIQTTPTGDTIMVIHVPMARREEKPVYINNDIFGGSFRRNWEGDYHCSRSEVLAMLRDETEETADTKTLDKLPLDILLGDTLQRYRNRHVAYKPGHPWELLDNSTYLERIGAAAISSNDGQLHPTAAGLLMFAEEYQIVREFPEYFLDYRDVTDSTLRWVDRVYSSSGDWNGNLFDFYFRVYNKLIENLKVPFKIKRGNRIDDTPVHDAIREALANCLINTDFYMKQGIVIKKEKNCLTLENPGYIRIGKIQMRKGGISDPRNKGLMKMFNLINIGERAGSGVPDIFAVWHQEKWQEPQIIESFSPDRTILKLPLIALTSDKKQAIKTSDKKQAIKSVDKLYSAKTQKHMQMIEQFLKDNGESKTSSLAQHLNLSEGRTRAILKELLSLQRIQAKGKNKTKIYFIP